MSKSDATSRRAFSLALTAGFLPAFARAEDTRLMSEDTRRVASKLACLCRSCKNTVGDCPMLDCGYCSRIRPRITEMLQAGKDDQSIVDVFVKEEGKEALAAPPNEGFSLFAWWMPVAALGTGLAGVAMVIRRYMRPVAGAVEIDPRLIERYRDQMDEDLSKLE